MNLNSRMILSEINVTPMVDVMLVLLIMFMVTAPMMQQGMEVNLPKVAASGVPSREDPFVVVITSDQRIKLAQQWIDMKNLREKLKAIFQTRTQRQIYIRADRQVPYGFVAETMGEIRAAGIYDMALITLPKEGKSH